MAGIICFEEGDMVHPCNLITLFNRGLSKGGRLEARGREMVLIGVSRWGGNERVRESMTGRSIEGAGSERAREREGDGLSAVCGVLSASQARWCTTERRHGVGCASFAMALITSRLGCSASPVAVSAGFT